MNAFIFVTYLILVAVISLPKYRAQDSDAENLTKELCDAEKPHSTWYLRGIRCLCNLKNVNKKPRFQKFCTSVRDKKKCNRLADVICGDTSREVTYRSSRVAPCLCFHGTCILPRIRS